MPFSRRAMVQGGAASGMAAILAGMTFPKSLGAQTPAASPAASPITWEVPTSIEGEVPAKTLSGTVVLAAAGEPQSFQPDFQADDSLWPIACNIYNSLLSLDNSFNVIPELATGYTVSDDGLQITFALNPLATWHDGVPVTSLDVKYTLEQIVADKSSFGSSSISAITSVDTPDAYTAVLNLSAPSASIIGFLSWYAVFILPAHIYEGTDWSTNPANQQPIGSGPFKFVSYTAGATVELAANEAYFGEGPYIEKLVYNIIPDDNTQVQALLNGEVDYIPGLPSSQVATLQATPGFKVNEKVYPSPIHVGFNFNHAPLDNVEVRRAIGQAIDRQQILDIALGGLGTIADRYYPAVIEWASNPDATVPAYDPDAANAALDAAGFPLNGDSRFDLKLYLFTGWPEVADTATILKEQLGAIGVNVELVSLESASWLEQVQSGESDLAILGGFQGPDPAALKTRFGTGASFNLWFYSNPEFDDLLAQGDAATSQEERVPIYFQAQEILAEDIPALQLVLQTSFIPFSDRLSGIWTDPDDAASSSVGMNRFTLAKLAE